MDWLKEVVSGNSAAIFSILLTVILTIFARCIVQIFRLGVNFKSTLTTKDEMVSFQREVREDMKHYKTELTEAVMSTSVKIIEEKLKDLQEIRTIAIDMKQFEGRLSEQIKTIDEKYSEIKSVNENLKSLHNRVEILSMQQGNETQQRRKDV